MSRKIEWDQIIAAYPDGHINVELAARLPNLPVDDLRERFLRLGVPLRPGPGTMEEAQAKMTVGLSWLESAVILLDTAVLSDFARIGRTAWPEERVRSSSVGPDV
ncbi:hypothetical protein [Thermoflexus hugenholtzii]